MHVSALFSFSFIICRPHNILTDSIVVCVWRGCGDPVDLWQVVFSDMLGSPDLSAVQLDAGSTFMAEDTSFEGFEGEVRSFLYVISLSGTTVVAIDLSFFVGAYLSANSRKIM